jgi:hypothetical protein
MSADLQEQLEGQPVVIARHFNLHTGPSHVLRPSRTALASLSDLVSASVNTHSM